MIPDTRAMRGPCCNQAANSAIGAVFLAGFAELDRIQCLDFRVHCVASRLRIVALVELAFRTLQEFLGSLELHGGEVSGAGLPGHGNGLARVAHLLNGWRRFAGGSHKQRREQGGTQYDDGSKCWHCYSDYTLAVVRYQQDAHPVKPGVLR